MNYIQVKDTKGAVYAVNPEQVTYVHQDTDGVVFVFPNDRRIHTSDFKSVNEVVQHVREITRRNLMRLEER